MHFAPVGNPEHERLTAELKPFVGEVLIVKFEDAPAVTVALVGETPNGKIGRVPTAGLSRYERCEYPVHFRHAAGCQI